MEIVSIENGHVTVRMGWFGALAISAALHDGEVDGQWSLPDAMRAAFSAAALAAYMQDNSNKETLETMRQSIERGRKRELIRAVG